jgi:hypothetical protein
VLHRNSPPPHNQPTTYKHLLCCAKTSPPQKLPPRAGKLIFSSPLKFASPYSRFFLPRHLTGITYQSINQTPEQSEPSSLLLHWDTPSQPFAIYRAYFLSVTVIAPFRFIRLVWSVCSFEGSSKSKPLFDIELDGSLVTSTWILLLPSTLPYLTLSLCM